MNSMKAWGENLKEKIAQSYLGNSDAVELILTALLAQGHVLVEDYPGTGKTLLARKIATLGGGEFRHIQCTPDLLPSDVLGVSIYNEEKQRFLFRKGPVVCNFLLVDEINRATPRTQSALLEAMAEGQVTVEGKTLALPKPFFMIATQSPVDSEGTFPLPEVQKDRFLLSLSLGYPELEDERKIMTGELSTSKGRPITTPQELMAAQEKVKQIYTAPTMKEYILQIIEATRSNTALLMGVSPRGTLALHRACQARAALKGRDFIVPEDVQVLAEPVLRQRIILRPERYGQKGSEREFIAALLEDMEVPPMEGLEG